MWSTKGNWPSHSWEVTKRLAREAAVAREAAYGMDMVLLPLSCEECSAWTRSLLPLSCEECSVHCVANYISHTLCFKQTRSCFSKNILFFSFHTLNIFLLSTLVYVFNLQCWWEVSLHGIGPSHFKRKWLNRVLKICKIQMELLDYSVKFFKFFSL